MSAPYFQLKKNVISAIIAFSVNISLVFFSYRLIISYEGISSLGLWSTLMAWIYMIRFGDVGMTSASTRFISVLDRSSEPEKVRLYIDTGILFNATLFLILSCIGYLIFSTQINHIIPASATADALDIIPLMCFGFFLTNMSGLVGGTLLGLHLGYISSRLGIVCSILQLSVVAALVPSLGLKGLAWGIIVQHTAMILLGWTFIYKRVKGGHVFPTTWSFPVLREMLGYSLKVQATGLANGFFEPLSKIIVSRFGSLEVQGIYELAYKTVSLPRNAVVAGAEATLPATTNLLRHNLPEANLLYRKVLRRVFTAVAAVLTCVVLAAPLISIVWMGSLNSTYWAYVACLAIGFLGNVAGAPAYNLGLAAGKVYNNLKSATLVLAIMAGFGWFVGQRYGAQGVVIVAASSLMFGGLYIKRANEPLLY